MKPYHLFNETYDALQRYLSDKRIREKLGGMRIVTTDDWNKDKDSVRLNVIKGKVERGEKVVAISQIFSGICGKGISTGYIKNAIAHMAASHMDAIIVVGESNRISGFLIVERGECKQYPKEFSIKLICTSGVKARLLIGALFYCLKSIRKKTVVLDMAGGTSNKSGHITYSKMGFNYCETLNDCDFDYGMRSTISNLTYNDIILLAVGEMSLSKLPTKSAKSATKSTKSVKKSKKSVKKSKKSKS